MYVKVYSYHIKPGMEREYLQIQEEAEQIYARYIDKQTLHLKSKYNQTKWMEIHMYESEELYKDRIQLIDQQSDIQELYKRFLTVVNTDDCLSEEEYELIIRR
ncbi:hypothetical protein [Mesobacillus subterraneus]|uniref:ABM domain-containing protein n=1 Tax=Mesobacillus subterraneus TaxID=285983 RepID=A0A427TWQ0_9BACI|nr:hypothetical protein [Mesobacillus subterraneus]RSD28834.1 hypothetical protein EJA10_04490 [Mesobacillus subterraneus]